MTVNLPTEEICEKYQDGISPNRLAELYGCSRPTILRKLRDNGIKIRSMSEASVGLHVGKNNPRYIDLPIEKICNQYLNGISTVEIANEYGCSHSTITKKLHDSGIKVRSNSESHIGLQTGKDNCNYIDLPTKEICDKYLSGMNTVEIANEYGCNPQVITKRLTDNNIEIRSGIELSHYLSATRQGLAYDDWESYAVDQPYCPLFNKECRESNREKYGKRCFLSGISELENITSTGKQWKLSVHHVDMDKMQGCNGKRWKLIPLSIGWHIKVHTELWKSRIIWLLENVWNNNEYMW